MPYLALLFIALASYTHIAHAAEKEKVFAEQTWGVGALFRNAEIPFDTEADKVSSFVPMMFYQGETFFMRGIEGGAHLFKKIGRASCRERVYAPV